MARIHTVPKILQFSIYFTVILCCFTNYVSANRELDEDNWRDILEGEWMVEFYAPWCPACSALAPAWKELSLQSGRKALLMKAAAVDVTKSPGLSGRFVVTALPTIFHVKDGEFRQYKGPRDVDSMLGYVEKQRWKQTDPIPSWKAPNSLQMSLVAEFFKLSQALRTVHNMLMEEYGLPTWGSYLIFAIGTIFIGAILGLVLVCVIDLLYPPRRSDKLFIPQAEVDQRARGDQDNAHNDAHNSEDDDLELLNDDIVDDEEDNEAQAAAENKEANDAEKNSNCDTSDSDKEATTEGGGDTAPADGKPDARPEVRKRRPRKAD